MVGAFFNRKNSRQNGDAPRKVTFVMFDSITVQLPLAGEKLAHLRRFL